jgi:hypothetical protein
MGRHRGNSGWSALAIACSMLLASSTARAQGIRDSGVDTGVDTGVDSGVDTGINATDPKPTSNDPRVRVSCSLAGERCGTGASAPILTCTAAHLTSGAPLAGASAVSVDVCFGQSVLDDAGSNGNPVLEVTSTSSAGVATYRLSDGSSSPPPNGSADRCFLYRLTELPQGLTGTDQLTFVPSIPIQCTAGPSSIVANRAEAASVRAAMRCSDRSEFPTEDELADLTEDRHALCERMHLACRDQHGARLPDTTGLYGGDTAYFNRLVIVFGPDGRLRGSIPASVPEHVPAYALVYHRDNANYRVRVAGCDSPPIRVGSESVSGAARVTLPVFDAPPETQPPSAGTGWTVSFFEINRCAASGSDITVEVSVPGQGTYCDAAIVPARYRTESTTYLAVTVATVFNFGNYWVSGVTPGVGGQPGRVFERQEFVEFRPVAGVLLFPFGIPTSTGTPFFQRFGMGTAIALSTPFTDLNVVTAVSLLPGINVLLGMRVARVNQRLGGGLRDQDEFTDDSSRLPRDDRWEFAPAFSLGISIDQQLVTLITKPR